MKKLLCLMAMFICLSIKAQTKYAVVICVYKGVIGNNMLCSVDSGTGKPQEMDSKAVSTSLNQLSAKGWSVISSNIYNNPPQYYFILKKEEKK